MKQKIQCGGHMSLIAETKLFFSPIKRHIALCLYYFYFKICYNQKKIFFCLFLVARGLHCYTQAFFGCGMQASHYGGFSCGAEALGSRAQQLWDLGFVAPRHVGSSQTRDQTRVPCIDRWFSTPGPKRKSYTMLKKKNCHKSYQSHGWAVVCRSGVQIQK